MDSPFLGAQHYRPVETFEYRGARLPVRFAELADEYQCARSGAVLFDRSERGVVLVTGKDRKTWLHNLVTNVVKNLDDNAGNYAFALDLKGRIQFDLNILALPDALWLDMDALAIPGAIKQLDFRLITEDAKLQDVTTQWARLGCTGPAAAATAQALGAGNFAALPALGSVGLADGKSRLVRHDFAGLPGFELHIPRAAAAETWDRLAGALGVAPAGLQTLDVLRIEAGIPWLGRDIDDKVLAAETGQIERGISYHKGCYLGQEVVERMRSHGSLARRLVRLQVAGGAAPVLPVSLWKDGVEVGRVTSLVPHPVEPYAVGLGYVKTTVKDWAGITARAAADGPAHEVVAVSVVAA